MITITLDRPCSNHGCPVRLDCLLYVARPQDDSLERQPGTNGRCDDFTPDDRLSEKKSCQEGECTL